MGRLIFILGFVLFITAMIYMFVMLGGSENETSAAILESVLCEGNETIGQHVGSYQYSTSTSSGGRSISFFCMDSEGVERDVTLGAVGIIGGGFAAQIILGILMTMVGAGMMVRNRMKSAVSTFQNFAVQSSGNAQVFDLRDGSYQERQFSDIPPEKMEQVQQIMGQFGTIFGSATGKQESLSDKLKELEEARNNGLLSNTEYERVRRALLDSFDD